MAATADRKVRFGAYEVDLRAGELRRRGLTVKLQPLPFRVLSVLIESPGEVVTRDDLQRKLWPGDTYVEFDLGLNAAIKKLRRALGDNPRHPHFIETLPRKGYRFVFPVESISPEPAGVSPNGAGEGKNGQPSDAALPFDSTPPSNSRARPNINFRRIAVLVAGLVMAFSVVTRFRGTIDPGRDSSVEAGPLRFQARPLFELRGGLPRAPALSPDGKSIAFTWEGDGQPPGRVAPHASYVYVAAIDGGVPRRVTTGSDPEYGASWSPEGLRVAFVRVAGGKAPGVYVVSLIDGSLVKMGRYPSPTRPSWTPDGKWLIYANESVWKVSLETREEQEWIPEGEGYYYHSPAVSPDNKTLALARCQTGSNSCDVYLRPMGGGEPQRLTFENDSVEGLTWTPDSREIVFSMDGRMYRVPAVVGMQPGRLEFLSRDRIFGHVAVPSIASPPIEGSSRLAFLDLQMDVDMWVTDLPGELGLPPSDRRLIDSPGVDWYPEYSPDGSKIAFYSTPPGGSRGLWVGDHDGVNPRQLTPPNFRVRDGGGGGPSWSPDSRTIAFRASTREDPAFHIYTIGLDGGAPQRITNGENEFKPVWSRDGRHIYYCSKSKEAEGIWRVPSDGSFGGIGGLPVDTLSACFDYAESPDGRFIYSWGAGGDGYGALWRAAVEGGKREQVVAPFRRETALHFREEGLYFLPGEWADNGQLPLRLLNPQTGKITEVARVKASTPMHFSISPAGRSVLTNRVEGRSNDLMLVEDFR